MSKLVVATGVPGVGKSTVVDGVLEKLREEDIAHELISHCKSN